MNSKYNVPKAQDNNSVKVTIIRVLLKNLNSYHVDVRVVFLSSSFCQKRNLQFIKDMKIFELLFEENRVGMYVL